MENSAAFFYSRMMFWGLGMSLIMNITGTGFWISEILGIIIGFIILLSIKKANDSKVIKRITGFVFAFLATIIIANLGGTMYLKNTPNYILTLAPLIVGYIVSICEKDAFKKTIYILFVYSMFMFLGAMVTLVPNAKTANLLPMSFNLLNILEGTAIFVLSTITPILCLNDFKDKKSLLLNYSTSMLSVILISLLAMMVLGSQEAMLYRYPEFVLLKRIKVYEFFSNVENLFVIMIVTDFITTIARGLRNMEMKGKLVPFVVLFVLNVLASFACSHSDVMTFMYKFFPYVLIGLLILTFLPKIRLNKNSEKLLSYK